MKMDMIAGSHNDEFYTPSYAIKPILPYIAGRFSHAWCPFDTEESFFVKELRTSGLRVSPTHLTTGSDFFAISPPLGVDCVISNPPYSKKGAVLQRLFDLRIPFAMLVGVVGLFESDARFTMFDNNLFEILYLNRRVSYFKTLDERTKAPLLNPPFQSVYVCAGVLPRQICFAKINKKA